MLKEIGISIDDPITLHMLIFVEKYVLQNKASGLYATYTHKLQSLKLEQFESVETLITELDDLYIKQLNPRMD